MTETRTIKQLSEILMAIPMKREGRHTADEEENTCVEKGARAFSAMRRTMSPAL